MEADYKGIAWQLLRDTVVKEFCEGDAARALAVAGALSGAVGDEDMMRFACRELQDAHRRIVEFVLKEGKHHRFAHDPV